MAIFGPKPWVYLFELFEIVFLIAQKGDFLF